jgi:hypothetical protein
MEKKAYKFNYRALTVIGVVYIGAGATIKNYALFGLGVFLLFIGLASNYMQRRR